MHKSRMIIVTGVIVALLPSLGFPRAWESFFQVVAGLAIVGISVWSSIDRKISQRAKAQMRQMRKTVTPDSGAQSEPNPIVPAETPDFGKRVTDFYPKTGQSGRRLSDIKPDSHPIDQEEILN